MKVDPLALLVGYLKAQPELAGIKVSVDLVGHITGQRLVHVELMPGGQRIVRDRMDMFNFAINYYGADKRDASALAWDVREILIERLPATRISNYVVSDVEEDSIPYDFPDDFSDEQRFLHLLSIYVY